MYYKVGILLLGFAVASNAQATCSCDGLKECLRTKRQEQRKLYEGCAAKCINKFIFLTNVDVDAVQECLHTKAGEIHRLSRDEVECVLKPDGSTCAAGAARIRRQFIGGQGQLNTNVQVQPGSQTQTNGATGIEVDDVVDLRPYRDCVHDCIQDIRPSKIGGTAQGVHGLMRGIEGCSISNGCAVPMDTIAEMAQVCEVKVNAVGRLSDIEHRNCVCLRNALRRDLNC